MTTIINEQTCRIIYEASRINDNTLAKKIIDDYYPDLMCCTGRGRVCLVGACLNGRCFELCKKGITRRRKELLSSKDRRLRKIGKWMGVAFYSRYMRCTKKRPAWILSGSKRIHEDVYGFKWRKIRNNLSPIMPKNFNSIISDHLLETFGKKMFYTAIKRYDRQQNQIIEIQNVKYDDKNSQIVHVFSTIAEVIPAVWL